MARQGAILEARAPNAIPRFVETLQDAGCAKKIEAGQKMEEDADGIADLKRRPQQDGRNLGRRKHFVSKEGLGDAPVRPSRFRLANRLDRDESFKAVTTVVGSRSLLNGR
jgi:hypothetical protein